MYIEILHILFYFIKFNDFTDKYFVKNIYFKTHEIHFVKNLRTILKSSSCESLDNVSTDESVLFSRRNVNHIFDKI